MNEPKEKEYDFEEIRLRDESAFLEPRPSGIKAWAQEAVARVATRPKVKLLDISRYQRGEVKDPKAIWNAGYRGVIVQATYGLQKDVAFDEHWRVFLDNGFAVLTYHMFYGTIYGVDQAHHHLETIRPLWEAQKAKYPAFKDIEIHDGATNANRITRSIDWASEIRKETRPGTYCNLKYWQELMNNTVLGDEIGWVASWSPYETFTVPKGWTQEQVLFRQIGVSRKHSWVEIVPGMSGDVDVDVFYGTEAGLSGLAIRETPSTSLLDKVRKIRDLAEEALRELGV